MVNGSLPQTSMPFITSKQQEDICSELPILHSYSLDLLTAMIKGVGRYTYLIPFPSSSLLYTKNKKKRFVQLVVQFIFSNGNVKLFGVLRLHLE